MKKTNYFTAWHFVSFIKPFLITKNIPPLIQDVNWTYIRPLEDVLDVFWKSYVRSIHFLCPVRNNERVHFVFQERKSPWSYCGDKREETFLKIGSSSFSVIQTLDAGERENVYMYHRHVGASPMQWKKKNKLYESVNQDCIRLPKPQIFRLFLIFFYKSFHTLL